jgi:peptide deformylase
MSFSKLSVKSPPFAEYKKSVFHKAAIVSDFIYQIGESDILRKPSAAIPISKIKSREMQEKFRYLKKCLDKYRKLTGYGRGIAAVQIGIPERFSVIYTPQKLLIIVNPKITKRSKKLLKYPEMCMSAIPVIAPVIRPAWIEFDYYDEKGVLNHWNQKDDNDTGRMMNRVFQHEINHMNGVINIDIVKSPKELILESDPSFYKNAKFEKVK